MQRGYKFNRLELAGSLGDLGTLLPLAVGMILINGLKPTGLFLTVGIYYVFAGIYFGVTVPVQPMKAVAALVIAGGLSTAGVAATGLLAGILAAAGATLAGWLLAENLFELDYGFSATLWLAGPLAGVVFVGLSGMAATWRVVTHAPVSVLRAA